MDMKFKKKKIKSKNHKVSLTILKSKIPKKIIIKSKKKIFWNEMCGTIVSDFQGKVFKLVDDDKVDSSNTTINEDSIINKGTEIIAIIVVIARKQKKWVGIEQQKDRSNNHQLKK